MKEVAKASKTIDRREESAMYRDMAKDNCRRAIEVGIGSLEREAARYESLANRIDKEKRA